MKADHTQVTRLLKTARGQIDGILKMIEEDRYCLDVSNQLMATQSILKKANRMVLKAHMDCCVREAVESGDPEEKLGELAALLDQLADLDAAFHTLLYGMTHNILFERMTPVINDVIFENYYTKLYRNREQRLNAAETHRSLYQAIKNGDGQEAYALSKCHMEIMRDEICGEFLPRQEVEYEKTDQQTGGLREGNHGGNPGGVWRQSPVFGG